MKKICFILLSLLLLVACSNNQDRAGQEQTDQKLMENKDTTYVGFALDTLREDRWYQDKEAFEKEVTNLGGKVKTLAANGSHEVQLEQVKLLLNEGVDVLVIVPTDATKAAEAVELANEANVPVVSYDRLVLNANVDYYISFDNEKVGELQAQAIVDRIAEGNVAYIGGAESDNNAKMLREGSMRVLEPFIESGDIQLVYDQFTEGWSPETAQEQLSTYLEGANQPLNGIIAANDGTAGGAIEAIGNQAGNMPVSGQDAELEALQRIVNGTQAITVYKPIDTIAKQAASLAMNIHKEEDISTDTTINNESKDIPTILLEPTLINQDNIDEEIIENEVYTEEEIYQ
ncbi:D-xylose-binding protein XylF [Gracilibacillus halophilus YIM-C55.5]|uniref:D-xylose-binding protein XylF n=1 Tax=Gracilibacillus halophilus YIM-C55.5 TaxID=1308866 RepID=N4WRM2_9BACI|nr:substrate-binding domain-containing protein [Gracilibacillus halophilus]ENH95856.1 D-xylose-binding protein XylF [Gracilibacillus halophilus YIM-C55.5]